jgi:hypothetical protein
MPFEAHCGEPMNHMSSSCGNIGAWSAAHHSQLPTLAPHTRNAIASVHPSVIEPSQYTAIV